MNFAYEPVESSMAEGTLIAESLRVGATLEGFKVTVSRIYRETASLSPEQRSHGLSPIWTLIEFAVGDLEADRFAEALSRSLDRFGWYANFHTDTDAFVVFSNRVFRYRRDDSAGRAHAQAFARDQGVPETQLGWTD